MSLTEAREGRGVWIGHYGCAGRLVKVSAEDGSERSKQGWMRPRARHRLECPGCGFEHLVKVAWRRPMRELELDEAEAAL